MKTMPKTNSRKALPAIGLAILFLSCIGLCIQPECRADQPGKPSANAELRHVVCFKFRDGVSASDKEHLEKEFCALPGKIPTIVRLEWGINNSPEGLNKGLTHCFILTFKSQKDRDAYLVNPAHLEFVKLVKKCTDDVLVVDYLIK